MLDPSNSGFALELPAPERTSHSTIVSIRIWLALRVIDLLAVATARPS